MASITVSGAGLDDLLGRMRKKVEHAWARQQVAAEKTAEFGAKTARQYTATRPSRKSGKAGRFESRDMMNAIKPRMVSFSYDLIEAQYGFVDEYEKYFGMQTITGFRHNRSGEYIAPTFALRDSIGPTNAFARDAARKAE